MSDPETPGMGWMPDPPDLRDFSLELFEKEEKVGGLQSLSGQSVPRAPRVLQLEKAVADRKRLSFPFPPPPKHTGNVKWCPPIEDQKNLGSCTAQAGVGVLEYFERRAFGTHLDASRLFLYKVTRSLLGWTGDTGAYCRTTMGAIALFGVPPEKYWPYVVPDFDKEPSAFLYALAQNYQGLIYHRVDSGSSQMPLLTRLKIMIAVGWPLMFGFTVYQSYGQAADDGEFPYPAPGEKSVGGHAVVAIGYDDKKKVKNMPDGPETEGAFLIRNSWGTSWGFQPDGCPQRGYGWLPYKYVETGQARDWWSLTKAEWLETGNFGV
jgi:C1A family cysteine protease